MKRFVSISISFLLAAFIVCEIIGLTTAVPADLLSSVRKSYKFVNGFLLFIDILPSVVVTSFLVGFSIVFGRSDIRSPLAFSPGIYYHYRNVVIVAVIGTAISFSFIEVVNPYLQRQQKRYENDSYFFDKYLDLSQSYYNSGNYYLAYQYAGRVLEISPNNTTALNIKKASELYNTERQLQESPVVNSNPFMYQDPDTDGLTVLQLLQKSKDASADKRWLDAHYYAETALKLSDPKNTSYDTAKEMAVQAWNNLSLTEAASDNETHKIFKEKMDGYNALMSGDSLKAYYMFLSLKQDSRKNAADPDIKRYLNIAENRMKSEYFFIDEIMNLSLFNQTKDVYFAVHKKDGTTDVFFIKGVINVKSGGSLIQYCFGFTDYTFDIGGTLYRTVTVPYAKIKAIPVDDIDKMTQISLGLEGHEKYIPYILLDSVDRNKPGVMNKPVITYTDSSVLHGDFSSLMLSLPYSDFMLALKSNTGPEGISLSELLKFAGKAKKYGFASEIFAQKLLDRFLFPFFFLVFLMFIAIPAWNFRIDSAVLFKFRWTFFIPIIFFAVYFIYSALRYAVSLMLFAVIGLTGMKTAFFLMILFYAILFIAFSIVFLRRRDD